jgi:hypothetical protein
MLLSHKYSDKQQRLHSRQLSEYANVSYHIFAIESAPPPHCTLLYNRNTKNRNRAALKRSAQEPALASMCAVHLSSHTERLSQRACHSSTWLLCPSTNLFHPSTNLLCASTNLLCPSTLLLRTSTNLLQISTWLLHISTNLLRASTNLFHQSTNLLRIKAHSEQPQLSLIKGNPLRVIIFSIYKRRSS